MKFKFEKVSPNWHYNKFVHPYDELQCVGHYSISTNVYNIIDNFIANPHQFGGIKRIHIGDTVENVNNDTIDKRIIYMKKAGYTKENYFIEFINSKLADLEVQLANKYNLTHYHYCIVLIPPGQCMPVHDDTYSYLNKYMKRDYPNVKYDTSNIRRYLVFLTDWEWGQCFGAGNVIKWQWRVGDTYTWKYRMLHWASNASFEPMVFFEITGLKL